VGSPVGLPFEGSKEKLQDRSFHIAQKKIAQINERFIREIPKNKIELFNP